MDGSQNCIVCHQVFKLVTIECDAVRAKKMVCLAWVLQGNTGGCCGSCMSMYVAQTRVQNPC